MGFEYVLIEKLKKYKSEIYRFKSLEIYTKKNPGLSPPGFSLTTNY